MKIFLIADGSFDSPWLCDDRQSVTRAAAPDEALAFLVGETFDVVVVDVTSLSETDLSFIVRWCTPAGHTPLLALTGRHSADRVQALGLGADDALTQPADAGEMLARCTALIRRKNGQSRSLIQCGSLSLLLESREVWYRNVPVFLTAKEYSILEMLMLRQGGLVTTAMLMNRLYGGLNEPSRRIIGVFIAHLRQKFRNVGADLLIATVKRRGYQIRQLGEPTPMPTETRLLDTLASRSPSARDPNL